MFNKEFMEQFEEEHSEAFGKDHKLPVGEGYPDVGSGRYCDKLSYENWFKFNIGQRIHLNALETLYVYAITIFITSLVYPRLAVGLAVAYICLRIAYSVGYAIHP